MRQNPNPLRALTVSPLFVVLAFFGCTRGEKSYPEKAPLPVTVLKLKKSTPVNKRLYSGSVRSWKIEDIAFEVDGRVRWVVEPGMQIEGRTYRADGTLLSPGTQIAHLDDERFVTALGAAKSKVRIETLRRDSLQIQVNESLPAEIASAKSQSNLALTELRRNERLVLQGAGSGKNLDKAKADHDAKKSAIDGLNAKLLQAKSEVKSAEAAIEQAIQSQKDAERNLADTRLYSAFPGQVAAVHVVPGSLAGPKSKVATVQMMNPIKVELEISAQKSRLMMQGDTLMLNLTSSKGKQQSVKANVYAIAPSADNATRTFTLTLLVVNQKVDSPIPDGIDMASLALTPSLWRVGLGILPPVRDGVYYMPETGLHTDSKGSYVWRVTNFRDHIPVRRILRVAKLYVKPGDIRVPYLGRTQFRTVEVLPDQEFDPDGDLFATNLLVNGERPSKWNGDTMLLGQGQRWLLRPGDLVRVDLSGQPASPGIYAPVEAIHEESGQTSVFAVDGDTVRKIEVNVSNVVGQSMHRIEAVDETIELQGMRIVVEGVHYLIDGQKVALVGSAGEAY